MFYFISSSKNFECAFCIQIFGECVIPCTCINCTAHSCGYIIRTPHTRKIGFHVIKICHITFTLISWNYVTDKWYLTAVNVVIIWMYMETIMIRNRSRIVLLSLRTVNYGNPQPDCTWWTLWHGTQTNFQHVIQFDGIHINFIYTNTKTGAFPVTIFRTNRCPTALCMDLLYQISPVSDNKRGKYG